MFGPEVLYKAFCCAVTWWCFLNRFSIASVCKLQYVSCSLRWRLHYWHSSWRPKLFQKVSARCCYIAFIIKPCLKAWSFHVFSITALFTNRPLTPKLRTLGDCDGFCTLSHRLPFSLSSFPRLSYCPGICSGKFVYRLDGSSEPWYKHSQPLDLKIM